MRALVQRVTYGSVTVDGNITGEISTGMVILFGVAKDDTKEKADFVADKCLNLRMFSDSEGKMNLSVNDLKGEILVVSQFTLYGDTRKGRRPSFTDAGSPQLAEALYNYFVEVLKKSGLKVQTGVFKADMKVQIHNDGPVTFMIEN